MSPSATNMISGGRLLTTLASTAAILTTANGYHSVGMAVEEMFADLASSRSATYRTCKSSQGWVNPRNLRRRLRWV
jgi:hypothetical protein